VYEVVGVVADSKYRTAGEDAAAIAYFDFEQYYEYQMVLHARVSGDPAAYRGILKQVVTAVEPALVVDVATMREDVAMGLIPGKIAAYLLAALGGLGLLLASLGIYGVISYSAAQRTHEVGVRIAVGATPADIFRLIVGDGMALAVAGVAIGMVVAAGVATVASGMLVGVSRFDPVTYGGVGALLLAVALLACVVPALRSVRTDPIVALRAE
jgi:putative ABC transport system permease protein